MKGKVISLHKKAVRIGEFEVATKLFSLLRKKRITLGLGDTEWKTDRYLSSAGLIPSIDYRCYATYRI